MSEKIQLFSSAFDLICVLFFKMNTLAIILFIIAMTAPINHGATTTKRSTQVVGFQFKGCEMRCMHTESGGAGMLFQRCEMTCMEIPQQQTPTTQNDNSGYTHTRYYNNSFEGDVNNYHFNSNKNE